MDEMGLNFNRLALYFSSDAKEEYIWPIVLQHLLWRKKGNRRENDVQFYWWKRDESKGTLIGVHLEKVYQRLECLQARS